MHSLKKQNTLVVFQDGTTPNEAIQTFVQKYGSKQEIEIFFSRQQIRKMFEICRLLKEWRVKKLIIGYNQWKNIMKQIENVSFPQLTDISIAGNNISSIQGLCRISMPSLQILDLNNNNIASIKPLRKCDFPNLDRILIDNNNNHDCGSLTEMKAGNLLKWVFINHFQCHAWILKMEVKKIDHFFLLKIERNGEEKKLVDPVIGFLKKKYECETHY